MWMNAAKTMCAPGAAVSTLMALSCACVRLALNSMLTRLTAKVKFHSDVLSSMTSDFLTPNPWGFFAQSKPTRQRWLFGRYAFRLKRARCSTVGYDGLSIASGDGAPVKVSKPGLEAFLHVPVLRGAWITRLEPWTTSPLRKVWMTPLWAGGVSPSGTSPFSSFTSSLVAVIILLLAISVPCCVYWGQLHHRPPSQFPLYNHYTGAEEQWREYKCVCLFLGPSTGLHVSMSMYDCVCGCVHAEAFLVSNPHLPLAVSLCRPEWVQGVWKLGVWHLALWEHHRLISLLHGLPAWPPGRVRHRLWWVVKPHGVILNNVEKKQLILRLFLG